MSGEIDLMAALKVSLEVEAKDREVRRLRAALEKIRDGYDGCAHPFVDVCEDDCDYCIARTALEGHDTTSDREGET